MSTSDDILLVEDEPGIVDFMRRVLVRAGYSVRIAENGADALAALAECAPRLLILDLVLPGVSGFTVLEQIHLHWPTIPVVVTTANPHIIDTLGRYSVHSYLLKPFQLDELLAVVAAA